MALERRTSLCRSAMDPTVVPNDAPRRNRISRAGTTCSHVRCGSLPEPPVRRRHSRPRGSRFFVPNGASFVLQAALVVNSRQSPVLRADVRFGRRVLASSTAKPSVPCRSDAAQPFPGSLRGSAWRFKVGDPSARHRISADYPPTLLEPGLQGLYGTRSFTGAPESETADLRTLTILRCIPEFRTDSPCGDGTAAVMASWSLRWGCLSEDRPFSVHENPEAAPRPFKGRVSARTIVGEPAGDRGGPEDRKGLRGLPASTTFSSWTNTVSAAGRGFRDERSRGSQPLPGRSLRLVVAAAG